MLVIYLVRPGKTDPRTLVKYMGDGGSGLTRLGVTTAQTVADLLKQVGVKPDGIYYAPCAAGWQTSHVLAHVLTKPRQRPIAVSALADVLAGESGIDFELRLGRYLAKFRESTEDSGRFIFVVDQAVSDVLVGAWEGSGKTTPTSLEKASDHIRVLVRQ